MRTDKHKLKSLTPHQEAQFLDVVRVYQDEKNHFSDQLYSDLFNRGVNVKNNCSYFDIRDELAKDSYYLFSLSLSYSIVETGTQRSL